MRKFTLFSALLLLAAQRAQADPITSYAVFGNTGVTWGQSSTVQGGLTGSNANITVGSFTSFDGLQGGGALSFIPTGAPVTVNGDVTFNGGVSLGFVVNVSGSVNSGGDVSIGGLSTNLHNITALGNVNVGGTITGNIVSGQAVTIQAFSTVNGNIAARGAVSIGPGSTVSGTITQNDPGLPVNPATFSPVKLPPATSFTPGTAGVTGGGALAPGAYGDLNVSGTLSLTGGTYTFKSFTLATFSTLNLDLTKGPIVIQVAGDVNLGGFLTVNVNGQPAFTGFPLAPNPAVNQALAGDVLLETHGSFTEGSGFDTFFGTVFAPDGNINVSGSVISGALLAGGQVNTSSPIGTTNVFFEPSDLLPQPFGPPAVAVPEPSTLALLALGGGALAGWRRWRKRVTA
jgi:cytoskeletal protein CcmA (bactofilin family)